HPASLGLARWLAMAVSRVAADGLRVRGGGGERRLSGSLAGLARRTTDPGHGGVQTDLGRHRCAHRQPRGTAVGADAVARAIVAGVLSDSRRISLRVQPGSEADVLRPPVSL